MSFTQFERWFSRISLWTGLIYLVYVWFVRWATSWCRSTRPACWVCHTRKVSAPSDRTLTRQWWHWGSASAWSCHKAHTTLYPPGSTGCRLLCQSVFYTQLLHPLIKHHFLPDILIIIFLHLLDYKLTLRTHCHLTVKKLTKTWHFFQKNWQQVPRLSANGNILGLYKGSSKLTLRFQIFQMWS